MRDKQEQMRPILLKAGIPLALSFVGFIYSMIKRRRAILPNNSSDETHVSVYKTVFEDEFDDLESSYIDDSITVLFEEEVVEQILTNTQVTGSSENLQFQCNSDDMGDNKTSMVEEEIVGLKNQICALHDREQELQRRFLFYCGMTEQEFVLKELQNALELEIAHVELLGLKVETTESVNKMLESMVAEYFRVMEIHESVRANMKLLKKKNKKLLRLSRDHFRVLQRQASALQAKEAEISSSKEEAKRREQEKEELEEEIRELRRINDELRKEKKELKDELVLRETLASSTLKSSEENIVTEDPDHLTSENDELLTQLEQLQNDRASDIEELIYLRWVNVCLRHELMRYQKEEQRLIHEDNERQFSVEQVEEVDKIHCVVEYQSDGASTARENGETCMDGGARSHASLTKPKLLKNLKRWVKGKERHKGSGDDEHLDKCLGRWSVSDGAAEDVAARKSCSTVKPCVGVADVP